MVKKVALKLFVSVVLRPFNCLQGYFHSFSLSNSLALVFFLSKEIYMILEIWICPLTTWTTGQLPWVVTAPGCPGCSGMSRKMLKWTRHRDVWRTAVLTGVGSKNEMMTFHSFICHAHWLLFDVRFYLPFDVLLYLFASMIKLWYCFGHDFYLFYLI